MLNFHTQPAKFPSPRDVYRVVAGYPNMSPEAGRKIHELVKQERARYVLELGFNWGVSSCYIAAALRRNGGHLVTIRASRPARRFTPASSASCRSSGSTIPARSSSRPRPTTGVYANSCACRNHLHLT